MCVCVDQYMCLSCSIDLVSICANKEIYNKVMYFLKKVIKSPPIMTYNDEPLEYVQSFKYQGLNFNCKCSFVEPLDKLCSQARKIQTVLDLHVTNHFTMSVERAL